MRTKRHFKPIASYIVVVTCLLVGSPAGAESADEDARVLFREARVLATSGYYQAACTKFERSLQLERGVGTEFNLADCWEHVGRMASARKLFLKVAAETKEQGQDQRSLAATERADGLLTRLSRIQLQCASPGESSIRVLRAGVPLEQDSWQEPVEVDPGPFRVEAKLKDGTSWSTDFIVPNDPGTVVVSVPASNSRPSPAARIHADHSSSRRPQLDAPKPQQLASARNLSSSHHQENGIGVLPTTLLLVGVGGLGLSGASALWLNRKNAKASEICPTSESCTTGEIDRHESLVRDAKLARIGVYSGLGLGATSLAAAGIIYYLQHQRRREHDLTRSAVQLVPVLAGNGNLWGAAAQGVW
jgi:hypothetical protein